MSTEKIIQLISESEQGNYFHTALTSEGRILQRGWSSKCGCWDAWNDVTGELPTRRVTNGN